MKTSNSQKEKPEQLVFLCGYVGNEPQVYANVKGFKKLEFAFATHQRYQSSDGKWHGSTTWHRIIAWGKMADNAQLCLSKGCKINLRGHLIKRQYIDKLGNRRCIHEIAMTEFSQIVKVQKKKEIITIKNED
jgi:single-strand DNA-binding protein